ncbi:MAG: MFS transporter [Ilumatobacteraceae bacterium]
MPQPLLDDGYAAEVRANLLPFTLTRLAANTCYRFAPPFIAIIAAEGSGFGVSIADIGWVISISELTGFLAPIIGRFVDRVSRRLSIAIGLIGTTIGTLTMAVAPNLVVLAIGLTMLNLLKSCFDLGMGAWIADHVPFERRGRVVGITETSWALSLLIGVSLLGLITAASSWRVACVVGAAFVVTCGVWLNSRLHADTEPARGVTQPQIDVARTSGTWLVPLSMFGLMGASQCLFVTFGAWLTDDFGFDAAGIAAVGFALGAGELFASISSARLTDRIGKERSVMLGAAVMVPCAALLAGFSGSLVIGLAALAVFIIGFEYGVVSLIPVATDLYAGLPGKGFGLVIGAGTFGRGVLTVIATGLYDDTGVVGACVAAMVCAALSALTIAAFAARRSPSVGR